MTMMMRQYFGMVWKYYEIGTHTIRYKRYTEKKRNVEGKMMKLFTKVLKQERISTAAFHIRTGAKQKFVSNLILKNSSTMWQRV